MAHRGVEHRVVKGAPVHVVANHRALQPQVLHCAGQLLNGRAHVLHRQVRQPGETVGILIGELGHVVVAFPVHGDGLLGVQVVKVHIRVGGQHVKVHPQRVHVGNALLRRPERARIVAVLIV